MPGKKTKSETDIVECGNSHPLLVVPKEVRVLEKDQTWSCDGETCPLEWEEGTHRDHLR